MTRPGPTEPAADTATNLPPRWERLVEEHRQQAETLRRLDVSRLDERRWHRRLALMLLSMLALLVLSAMVWYGFERAIRSDPSRCERPAAASTVKAVPGGWGNPDTCVYFDSNGARVYVDAEFAGPVTRTYSDVLRESLAPFVALAAAATFGGAIAVVRSRGEL